MKILGLSVCSMEEDGDCVKKAEGEAGEEGGSPQTALHGAPISQLIAFGALCHSNHCSCNLVLIKTSASL